MVLSEKLYNHFSEIEEGRLSRIRAHLVNQKALAEIARSIELDSHLILGKGEKTTGKNRDSILSDSLEAILGGVYIDGGFESVKLVIENLFDLSNVMFIATCNSLASIQPALRDRMEIIEVTGYTVEEKVQIAKRHLVPKHLNETGITSKQLKLPVKTIETVVEQYTSESGVRGLEKRIGKLVRNRAKELALEEEFTVEVTADQLPDVLGPSREKDRYQGNDTPGVVTGLAWTPHGGDILFIETSLTKGNGKLTLTGNLGDVMKESAIIALEYIKSHAEELGLDADELNKRNVHLHVPQGAIPKDGPSAGITMVSAMVSAFTRRKIRKAVAMTGEITLRGQVLPVGGIKEKILAAKRAGIKEIILCERNRQDIDEIDARYLKGLTFTFVSDIMEVVNRAVLQTKVG